MHSGDHQEEEIKLTFLDSTGLDRLVEHLGQPVRVLHQRNTYYDTKGRELQAAKVMLRVREENDDLVVTAKSGTQIQKGGLRSREVEFRTDLESGRVALDRGLEKWEIAPVKHALAFLRQGTHLEPLGCSENTRMCYPWRGGVLEVDRSVLPGGVLHTELEFETREMEAELPFLQTLLTDLGIAFTDEVIPKFKRFLLALESDPILP